MHIGLFSHSNPVFYSRIRKLTPSVLRHILSVIEVDRMGLPIQPVVIIAIYFFAHDADFPLYIYSCLNKIYAGAKVIIPCPSVKYTFVSTYFSRELLLFLLATLIPASARADNANNSDQSVTLLASPVFGASTYGFLSSFVFAGVLASSLL